MPVNAKPHPVWLPKEAAILSTYNIAGKLEGEGNFGKNYDRVIEDDLWGEGSWEKAESKMFEQAVTLALQRANVQAQELGLLLGGDLLNQIISANYAARQLATPFFGVYGACSTMSLTMLLGGMLQSAGYFDTVACATCSHFATAERQFRAPNELGNQRTPTAQRTVTGAACAVLGCPPAQGPHVVITGGTVGTVIDMGVTDITNMGAAMAPAAADTIARHMNGFGHTVNDYDLIVTGDLGKYGCMMLQELTAERGIFLEEKLFDCGERIFSDKQDAHGGGSGCGCSGVVLTSTILPRMLAGHYQRVLFMATGALMSPVSSMQGETIPGVAHAVVLERRA